MRAGKEEGGVASRRILEAEREIIGENWGEFSEWARSEPIPVCRDEMDIASAWVREVVVRTDELLDFLERPRLKMLDVLEVDEKMLDVSL
jgi:hypothetical protein